MKKLSVIAPGLVVLIAVAGAALIVFNILDFKIEATRLYPSTTMLYTLPIAAVTLAAAYFAARTFTVTGAPQLWWLGCGALAFGIGSLARSWGGHDMNMAVTIKNSADLLASILFLIGVSLGLAKQRKPRSGIQPKLTTVLWCYMAVVVILAIITLLTSLSVMPRFYLPGQNAPTVVNIVQWLGIIFFAASACICLKIYLVARDYFSYRYFLGLALFALALFFNSQSSVDSVLSWLGRITEFIAGIYLIIAANVSRRTIENKG
jgi:hypothetical protein